MERHYELPPQHSAFLELLVAHCAEHGQDTCAVGDLRARVFMTFPLEET